MSVLPTTNKSLFLIVECLRETRRVSEEEITASSTFEGHAALDEGNSLRQRISSVLGEEASESVEASMARSVQQFLSSSTQPTDFLQASLVNAAEERSSGTPMCWVSAPATVESFRAEGISLKVYCEMLDDMLRRDEWTSWGSERVRVDIVGVVRHSSSLPFSSENQRRALLTVVLEEDASTSMTVVTFDLHPSPPSACSCEMLWRKVVMQVSTVHQVSKYAALQWAMTQKAREDMARLGREKLTEQEALLLSAQKVLNAKKKKIRALTSLLEERSSRPSETVKEEEEKRTERERNHTHKRPRSLSPSTSTSASSDSGCELSTERSTSNEIIETDGGGLPFASSNTPPPPPSSLFSAVDHDHSARNGENVGKGGQQQDSHHNDEEQNWLDDLFQP